MWLLVFEQNPNPMKIDYCLLSCDDVPMYLDFWPLVSKVWKLRFNVTPILIYIGNNPPENHYGEVIVQPPLKGVPLNLQSLWARYFYTSKFPDKISIISDIDMFPIRRQIFETQLLPISDDEYVHLYPIPNRPILATMFHVARGDTFKKFLELPNTFEESINQVKEHGKVIFYINNSYWWVDEIYATDMLKNRPVKFLPRPSYSRLDRADWHYTDEQVLGDHFIDCHCIRPYKEHKDDVDHVVDLLCK